MPPEDHLKLVRDGRVYFTINKDFVNFVEGGIVDFEDDLHKTGFVVKENPNAELTCSCKRSFSPKGSLFDKF